MMPIPANSFPAHDRLQIGKAVAAVPSGPSAENFEAQRT